MLKKKNIGQICLHIFFIIMCIIYIAPLLMVISASLSSETALVGSGFSIFPKEFSTEAYEIVFKNPDSMIRAYVVTITFSAIATFLSLLIMGLAAYPLSRSTFRFKKPITFYFFLTMLFSGGMVPSYLLNTSYLHLNDSIWIYILPGLVSAYNLFIIRTSYQSVPTDLIEAAKIDGGNELFICFKIVMPLSKATLASIGFLKLVGAWNEWYTASIYIRNPELYSLQYMLQRILREIEFLKQMANSGMDTAADLANMPAETVRYAMAMVAAGPMLVVFPLFQKYFVKGMTVGAVKG